MTKITWKKEIHVEDAFTKTMLFKLIKIIQIVDEISLVFRNRYKS